MQRFSHPRLSILVLSGLVACFGTACGRDPGESVSASPPTSATPAVVDTTSAAPTAESPESTEVSSSPQSDYYQRAIDRASSAFTISQAAQSQDDWNLAANRWQQAIALLEQIAPDNPNHGEAQTKLAEYRRNLDYAQQQASRPNTSSGSGIVVTQRDPEPVPEVVAPPPPPPAPSQPEPPPAAEDANELEVVRAPIIGRAGGTPVINVLFNGDRAFPMIVDTGASGTLITPIMAARLGVQSIGQTTVATASSDNVVFPIGRVQSMEVNGVVVRNVQVAVSGPELDIGLLGHDFFGNYDVTIREDIVEFRARR